MVSITEEHLGNIWGGERREKTGEGERCFPPIQFLLISAAPCTEQAKGIWGFIDWIHCV